MREIDPTKKVKLKKNLKSLGLLIALSLTAWFGVKALVYKPLASATPSTAASAKQSATLQLGGAAGATMTPAAGAPAGGGFPGGPAGN